MAVDMSQVVGIATGGKEVVQIADANGQILWRKGSQPTPTGGFKTATATGNGTASLSFNVEAQPSTFIIGAIATITNSTANAKMLTAVIGDGNSNNKANFITYTSSSWSGQGQFAGQTTGITTSYANGVFTVAVSGCQFVNGIQYKLEYTSGMTPTVTMKSTTVGSGVYQVQYTGLTKEPDVFVQMVMATSNQQVGNNNRTQYIVFHKGDAYGYGMYTGNTNRANYDNTSKFTYTYANGTLTIKAASIYVHQASGVTQELMCWDA